MNLRNIVKLLPFVKSDTSDLEFSKGKRYLKKLWPVVVIDIILTIIYLSTFGWVIYIICNG